MNYIVYRIENTINGKLYFGVTQQPLEKRLQQHKCNSSRKNYHLYRAIIKYGYKNFKAQVVTNCTSKEEMFKIEQELILINKSNERLFGYNNSTGGESSKYGCKLSEEQKERISKYQRDRKRNPMSQETKDKIGAANKGKKMSDKQKSIISARFKNKNPWNKGIKQKDYVKK